MIVRSMLSVVPWYSRAIAGKNGVEVRVRLVRPGVNPAPKSVVLHSI
jgi:hypothetical protein